MPNGKLILIEGTDSSGKQTQTSSLVEKLNEVDSPCESISFPQYDTPTGRIVGQCYLGKSLLAMRDIDVGSWFGDPTLVDPMIASLYYAADRRAARDHILEVITSGKHLVLDRYVESNMAHQGGKAESLGEREKIIDKLEMLEYYLLELPRPDVTLFLYMPWQVGMKLKRRSGTARDGHEANPEHLRKAEETYLYLSDRRGWKRINCTSDGTIDTLRSPEDIEEEVYQAVLSTINP